MTYTTTHHSFSVELAMKYGQEIATLIHHFQHWIKLNRRKQSQKHFRDGRWWTYQTREDIQNFLPYMDIQKIRWLTDQMIEKRILIKGNYNKIAIDKTLWYAFVDENEFLGTDDSNNVYESGKPQSSVVNRNPCAVNHKPIPDPKSSDPKTTDKEIYKKGSSTPPSAAAEGLLDLFLLKIKERNPEFKDPNRKQWLSDIDKLLRIDKRSVEKTSKIIVWASTHKWFKTACLSPAKLRKDYDAMIMQMDAGREEETIVKNRQFVLNLKEKYPDNLKSLFFDKNFVGNRSVGKEIPFNLPHETFKELFIQLFGGQYVR